MGSEALKAANTMQVRQHNKTVIRQAMLCLRQATRPQLAQKTGLSQVTVSAVLAELMEKGEVESCGSVPSEGGRPSACYRYRGERHNAGVLYTYQMEGRTLVQLEVFDLFGDRVDRASQFLGDLRPESFDALLDAAFQETPDIRTLALGVPGQVEGEKILFCDHRALAGDALSRRWKGRYHVPVLLENDINAAVLGYVQGLPGEVAGLTAGLYFPGRFGPGMGLALGRSPWPGRQGFVGEFHYLYGLDQWNGMDHGNPAAVEETAARYLRAVCVMAGPERVVLYGDIFRPGSAEAIRQKVEKTFYNAYGLQLEVRRDMGPDYSAGMKALALRQLKRTLFGTAWEEE